MRIEIKYREQTEAEKRRYWESLPNEISCLTVRQPWADLLVGRIIDNEGNVVLRPLENRSWIPNIKTPFPLVIHAGKTIDEAAMNRFKMKELVRGALVGIVTVEKVVKYTPELWNALRDAHMETGNLPQDAHLFAWVLKDQLRLKVPVEFLVKKDFLQLINKTC